MVIKPVTLVVIAALAVVGAGAGAYLAVREYRQTELTEDVGSVDRATEAERFGSPRTAATTPPEIETGGLSAMGAERAVDETEEIIVEGDTRLESSGAPGDPSELDPPARNRVSAPAPVASRPEGRPRAPEPAPTSGTGEGEQDRLAALEGWKRSDTPPSIPVRDRIPSSLGIPLSPEDRPRIIEELVIPTDAVIGLQMDTSVSTDDAKVEDTVEARVTRDVVVGSQIAIPAGTRVLGSVVLVETAGRLKGDSRLGVRFHTVILDDIVDLPVSTETVYREAKGRGNESAAKIGGAAVGGAILGAIFGGRQGAAIGGAAGAATGTAAAMGGDGPAATLPAGATVTIRLSKPATVIAEY